MRSTLTVSLYLNKSYQTRDGLYPVKIRLTYRRKSRYYKTNYFLSEIDFSKSYKTLKPRGQFITLKDHLLKLENKAIAILNDMESFSFEEFKNKFYNIKADTDGLKEAYDLKIESLLKAGKLSTRDSYYYSKKSIQLFAEEKGISKLVFKSISSKFLQEFESWMIDHGKSNTTIGIYLRCLRSLYNEAIHENKVSREYYPFGQRQYGLYSIPSGNNTKKALSLEHISLIQNYEIIGSPIMELSRDFWLLSFYCAGINPADLLRLRQKDYNGKSISFIRHKTKSTSKSAKETIIYLPPQAVRLIEKHKKESTSENAYLFGFLQLKDPREMQRRKISNFNNMVRKQMHKLAEILDIPIKLGMMHARHSFANVAWNKQVPVSYIADCMSHTSVKTTSSYLKSISDENRIATMNTIFEGL